ncbi:type VI secretion system membrane subunit TssM [Enterobacter asburiae]|uniref:type VI secretion system membrane subunit TssM n=1 Tax=Enterobacter asburiae TaxID=61645 RepID=UPI002878E9C9|nr:type VI secretion system membrane subunit TssM [Enterobacter asburiae]MDS1916268.1 type VI secretion system membrane subunit TssM [Enterobacter asburiae]
MSYSNRVFAVRFLKMLLIMCCIGLLVAAIWFLGPLFGFGESRPLLSSESRIIFILLAVFCMVGIWLSWPVFIMTIAALCVVVWVLGPFLLVGEKNPLEPISIRLILIAVMLFLALLYGLWLLLLALKDNQKLLDKLNKGKARTVENDTSEAVAAIVNAVDYVNKNRSTLSFFQRVILARKPLDLLPWYIVLGTNDAGKTSAILASGQNFPVPEQLNQVGKSAVQTRNCQCWLANDAIYVDTAGKYVSNPEQNLIEWRAILTALKKHRPVRPLNGAVITFSAADLLGRSTAELFVLAASLRSKIEDLREMLGVRFPVYVLVTKLDQLPGFFEYFRNLTEQEREQVWGVTFPYGDVRTEPVPEMSGQIRDELALLEERIEREMIVRQQEEYDNRDRKKMYALPQDFHLLSGLVADVVHNIFFASSYNESQSYTLLRGIYFCSSHQPVDFSLVNNQSIMRKWFNYIQHKTPSVMATLTAQPKESDFLINDVSYKRQYFLKQLFSDVIVKDKDLARHNLANESKFRLQRLLGHTLSVVITFILLNGFYHSYGNNSDYLAAVKTRVATLGGEVNRFVSSANDILLPRILMLAQSLPDYGSLDLFNPTLDWHYGLYTGTDVVEASGSLYQYFLQRQLLPQIEQQSTMALQEAIDSGKPERIYDQLKLYLQVFGQGKFDHQYLMDSITNLWEAHGKLRPYDEHQIFVSHLRNLLSSPEWRRYGQPVDDELVKYARAILQRQDLASRLYARLKDDAAQDAPADLTLSNMAKSRSGELFSIIDEHGESAIPGLFTRSGYYDVFKKKMDPNLISLEREDAWVSGNDEEQSSQRVKMWVKMASNTVQQQVLALYLDEYTQHWQDFLSNIRIKTDVLPLGYGSAGLAADIYMLRALSASDSPLANLVTRAVHETTLVGKEYKSLLDNVQNKGQILNAAAKVSLDYAEVEKKLLQERVDDHFSPLRVFVTGSREPAEGERNAGSGAELSKLLGSLSELYTLFVIYDDALKNGNAIVLSNTAKKIGTESQTWPDPLSNLIAPFLDGAWTRANQEAIAKSSEGIDENLGRVCRATLQGRYPFAWSQIDVKQSDFERFFAAGGLVDEYFKKNLADKVDTYSHPWRFKGDIEGNESKLEVFEQAAEIRDAFFQSDGGRKLSLTFDIVVPYLDPAITQLNMNFDGKQVSYAHWPVAPISVAWPASHMTSRVSINATPRVTAGTSSLSFSGPWALFRWMDSADDMVASEGDDTVLVYKMDSRQANIQVSGLTYKETPVRDLLKAFRCPGDA